MIEVFGSADPNTSFYWRGAQTIVRNFEAFMFAVWACAFAGFLLPFNLPGM